mmetsp:Transcript_62520/g.118261  ORF Transcript_62520/g.118261 Transcript_62520/m.118261 type:complete len:238 (-) Transcript_62520:26-739(-)
MLTLKWNACDLPWRAPLLCCAPSCHRLMLQPLAQVVLAPSPRAPLASQKQLLRGLRSAGRRANPGGLSARYPSEGSPRKSRAMCCWTLTAKRGMPRLAHLRESPATPSLSIRSERVPAMTNSLISPARRKCPSPPLGVHTSASRFFSWALPVVSELLPWLPSHCCRLLALRHLHQLLHMAIRSAGKTASRPNTAALVPLAIPCAGTRNLRLSGVAARIQNAETSALSCTHLRIHLRI